MSINMAWAALKSAVGAAPVAAAAASQVAAEQVPSTWDVLILHTHSFSISVFLHGEGSLQMYGSKWRFIHPEICPGCDSFPSPNHPPLSVNVCDPVKFHPNVVCPCLPSTHFLAQCWCLYFRCLLLCVALPQWSLMCLWLRWYPGNCILDKYILGIWTLCFPSSVLVLLSLLQPHSLNLWLPRFRLTNLFFSDQLSLNNYYWGHLFVIMGVVEQRWLFRLCLLLDRWSMSGMIRLLNTGDQTHHLCQQFHIFFKLMYYIIFDRKGLLDETELECINMGGADVKWQWLLQKQKHSWH